LLEEDEELFRYKKELYKIKICQETVKWRQQIKVS